MSNRNKPNDIWKYFDLNPVPPCTCWLWIRPGSVSDKGIPTFTLGGKKIAAYRITYWITHPEWDINDSSSVIRHSCTDIYGNAVDNPLCGRPDHLSPGTHDENMMDMMLRGRRGLRKEAIRDILDLGNAEKTTIKLTHDEVARLVSKKYNIDCARTTVTDILSGRRRLVMKRLLDEQDRAIRESGDST